MARDIFHLIVREALQNDGWQITHDLYLVKLKSRTYEVDLAAEQLVAAEKDTIKIAIEVKSFVSQSISYEFHGVLGQYLNYQTFMAIQEPNRILYLAVPKKIYQTFFMEESTKLIVEKFEINLAVFNPTTKRIDQWIPTY